MNKNKHIIAILLASVFVISSLSGCSKETGTGDASAQNTIGKAVDKINDNAEAGRSEDKENQENKAEKKVSEKEEDNKEPELSEDMYKADANEVFSAMADWAYTFSSGAGGWATELYVNLDGSFWGRYYDGEMGSTGPGFSNGTMYECDFSGHFSPDIRYAGPLMYCITIADMEYKNEPDTEEIKDNTLYKYSTPYGLEDITGVEDALVFMDAGAVTSAINKEEMSWLSPMHFGNYVGEDWDYVEDRPDELPFAAIINTKNQYAFFSDNVSDRNKTFLINKVKLPGLKNTISDIHADGTYYFEDVNADNSCRVTNICFPVNEILNIESDAEKIVKLSLKQVYGNDMPNDDDLYITTPKEAFYMNYCNAALCGEYSDYAFWYPDGSEGGTVCYGRFVFKGGNMSDKSYIYAYIIESNNKYTGRSYPDSSIANYWISSLALTGKSDSLSSAAQGKGAVTEIMCDMKVPKDGKVLARQVIMVGMNDTELIKKYHLEDADFDDDYEMVVPDRNYREYTLADGTYTPFYMQYPEDNFHRLYYAYDIHEYMNRYSEDPDNYALMNLYLNEDGEILYGFEQYTP